MTRSAGETGRPAEVYPVKYRHNVVVDGEYGASTDEPRPVQLYVVKSRNESTDCGSSLVVYPVS